MDRTTTHELSLSSGVDVVELDYRQMHTRRIAEATTTAASKLGYVSAYDVVRLSGTVIGNTFRNHVVILLCRQFVHLRRTARLVDHVINTDSQANIR